MKGKVTVVAALGVVWVAMLLAAFLSKSVVLLAYAAAMFIPLFAGSLVLTD